MDEKEHFKRLNKYYKRSKIVFNLLLGGSQHFGFYPRDRKVSEKEAQLLMQDLVAENLNLSSKMKLLDAGCGQGVVSTYLAKKFNCEIEGITVVPFEVEKAKALAKKYGISYKVNYQLMDYSNTEFKDEYFDAIYTVETLSHAVDIKKTLYEFMRVLKGGGKITLFEYTIAEDNEFSNFEKNILDKVIYGSAMDGLKNFRHDKFSNIIKECGFKKIRCRDITENVSPSLRRLRKFFFFPYILIKVVGLQKIFPNPTASVEFCKMGEKGLIRYNIFTAYK